jgi:hypothetical protein
MATVQAPVSPDNEPIKTKQAIGALAVNRSSPAGSLAVHDVGKSETQFEFNLPSKSLGPPLLGENLSNRPSGTIGVGWDLQLHSTTSGSENILPSAIQSRIADVPASASTSLPAATPPLQHVPEKLEAKVKPGTQKAGCLSCIQRPSVKQEEPIGL